MKILAFLLLLKITLSYSSQANYEGTWMYSYGGSLCCAPGGNIRITPSINQENLEIQGEWNSYCKNSGCFTMQCEYSIDQYNCKVGGQTENAELKYNQETQHFGMNLGYSCYQSWTRDCTFCSFTQNCDGNTGFLAALTGMGIITVILLFCCAPCIIIILLVYFCCIRNKQQLNLFFQGNQSQIIPNQQPLFQNQESIIPSPQYVYPSQQGQKNSSQTGENSQAQSTLCQNKQMLSI